MSGFNSHGGRRQEQTNTKGQHGDGPRQSACAGGNGRSHQRALGNTRKNVSKSRTFRIAHCDVRSLVKSSLLLDRATGSGAIVLALRVDDKGMRGVEYGG